MAAKSAALFDDIIQADRLRRKNEALANEIFGKGRKARTQNNGTHNLGPTPSLASRVGIAKASQRSVSSKPTVEGTWGHDLHHVNNPQALRASHRENPMARGARNARLYEAAASQLPRNGTNHEATIEGIGEEISIRGIATGPYVVIGSNFAPGTTAADIKSAMEPSGGVMQSCIIISLHPTVDAEMVFAEKPNAENVIATFHNKKADGRILNFYLKQGRPSVTAALPEQKPPIEQKSARIDPARDNLTHVDTARTDPVRASVPRVDLTRGESSYDSQREQLDRVRRRAEPEFQDGSYGFEPKHDRMDVDVDDGRTGWQKDPREDERARGRGFGRDDRRLYSDDIYRRPRGRGYR